MAKVIKTTFKLKRGTSSQWRETNPVLQLGEPGYVTDLNLLKIGDGVTAWNNLLYLAEDQALIVNVNTQDDLPATGNANVIYRAIKEKQLYQWNEEMGCYDLLLFNNAVTKDQMEVAIKMSLEGYATQAYAQELFDQMVALTHAEILEICN